MARSPGNYGVLRDEHSRSVTEQNVDRNLSEQEPMRPSDMQQKLASLPGPGELPHPQSARYDSLTIRAHENRQGEISADKSAADLDNDLNKSKSVDDPETKNLRAVLAEARAQEAAQKEQEIEKEM